MKKVQISQEMVKMQCSKMPNSKAPGKDAVLGYWLKNLTSLHPCITVRLNIIFDGERPSPDWITFEKTVLCQKDLAKSSATDNYRPISCLPLMWKLMTGMLVETMYSHLEGENELPSEQKGCRKGNHETKYQLVIDKKVLKDHKGRHTNLTMARIDHKKAYDMVPQSWIGECLEMFNIANNIQDFLNNSMNNSILAFFRAIT